MEFHIWFHMKHDNDKKFMPGPIGADFWFSQGGLKIKIKIKLHYISYINNDSYIFISIYSFLSLTIDIIYASETIDEKKIKTICLGNFTNEDQITAKT